MKKLREEISFNIIKCKSLIQSINKFDPDKSQELNNELEQLLNKFENDIKKTDETLVVETNKNLEVKLVIALEEFIEKTTCLQDLYEIKTYFYDMSALYGDYDTVVLNYNKIVKKLDSVSNLMEISELSKIVERKYEFLYFILCKAVKEKKNFQI